MQALMQKRVRNFEARGLFDQAAASVDEEDHWMLRQLAEKDPGGAPDLKDLLADPTKGAAVLAQRKWAVSGPRYCPQSSRVCPQVHWERGRPRRMRPARVLHCHPFRRLGRLVPRRCGLPRPLVPCGHDLACP